MCSTAPTTSYGHELSPGDDDMTGTDTKRGGRDYTCGDCGTVVSIAASGLVNDICEKAAA